METMKTIKIEKASSCEEAFFYSNQTYIHESAIIGPNVTLGSHVKIGPGVVIAGNVSIGDNTRIYPNAIIGFPAQNVGTLEALGTVEIKENCEIREFVTINSSKYPDGKTIIGANCYLMTYSHISHDCILENNVTLINSVNLGGHTHIEHNVMMMAGSATHQFCRVGKYSALAPFSAIRQDLPPFCLFDGKPARFNGLNTIGLKRAGFTSENLTNLKRITKIFYFRKKTILDIEHELASLEWGQDSAVQQFIEFAKASDRGISRASLLDK